MSAAEETPLLNRDKIWSTVLEDFLNSEHGMAIITGAQAIPFVFGYCCWATFASGMITFVLSATAYNVSHLIQLPIILGMQAYLLYKYHGVAKTGHSLPLGLQILAAILMIWFPIKELADTELTKGLATESVPPGEPFYSGHLAAMVTNAAGMALTIAASLGAARTPPIQHSDDSEP